MSATFLQRIPLVVLILLISLLAGCQEEATTPSESLAAVSDDTALEHASKHLDPKYVCPMHPQIVRDEAGTCPICGMTLVPKRIGVQGSGHPTVEVSHAVVQNLGVRTAAVQRDTLWKYIRTVGRVDYDETRLSHVHPRAAGWLESLGLRAEGDPVTKGQILGELYSPEILGAQVDFLISLGQPGSQGGGDRIEKARNRLRLLGVGEGTIRAIEKERQSRNTVPLYSPSTGVVTKLGAREGMYIKPETEFVTIADLSRTWVLVDVYEHQIEWLQTGLSAEIMVPAYPGRTWEGAVDYIYPDLDPRARTLKVRLAFANPDGQLKANMFAEVTIYGGPRRDVLVIPRAALIETGERSSVIKDLGGGRFEPVDVVTGMRQGEKIEILSGLQESDRVVVSGQFLIDSESSLQASFLRMSEGE